MYPSTGLQTALNKMREMSVNQNSIYHQFVPVVTDSTTIGEFGAPILDSQNVNVLNDFVSLLKKVVYTAVYNKTFNNPLASLEGERMPLGQFIEDAYVNPAKARGFNVNDFAGLLQKYDAEIAVQYFAVNSDLQYCVTITREKIRNAFTSWSNLESFVSGMINSLYNGAYITRYNQTKGLPLAAYTRGAIAGEVVSAVSNEATGKAPMTYAVGDGNHSLATAKACYEELKAREGAEKVANHPARFALVELENIYDEAQVFEPIHRLLTSVDVNELLEYLQTEIGGKGTAVKWFANGQTGELSINDENGELPLEVIQIALDKYLKENVGEIDYIHGDETLEQLSQKENTIGFLMPNVTKNAFFENIVNNGVMPRKTFSMGEAEEKRYYLEGRRITE